MAYPAFRSAGAVSGTTGTSITPALPTGWQIDDICFLSLFVYDLGGAPSFNVPAGWSLVGSILQNTSGSEHFHHEVYWRRMQSGDAAPNVTLTATSSACYAGTISAYSACTTSGTPYENVVTNIVPRTTTADGTAVTTSGIERLAVQLWASDDNATSTPPSGWTERQDAGTSSGSDAQFAIDTRQVATATTLARADRTAFSTTSLGTSVVGLALISSFTKAIVSDADDGLYFDGAGWFSNTDVDVGGGASQGDSGFGLSQAGFRFTSVAVPQGASVSSATIFLTEGPNGILGSDFGDLLGVSADNAAAWSGSNHPNNAVGTTAAVAITSANYLAINVTSIVQEIVNRAGWSPGNAMAFFGNTAAATGDIVDWTDYSNAGGVGAASLEIAYAAGGGGINGTLGVTIAAVTQSASADLLIQGTAAQTISAVTQSATGKVLVQGSLAVTVDAVTLAASGGSAVSGTFAQTIDAVELAASGKVLVQGSLASTIAPVTQAATGKVIVAGSLAQTIDPVTLAASGSSTAVASGALNATLDAVTLVASGAVIISGSLAATIAPVTQSSAGAVVIAGALAATIAPVTQSGTGALVIQGTFGKTIDPVTLAAAGSASLPAIEGTFGQVIDAVTLFAAATISQPEATGTPYWGPPGGHIPRDQLARAVKALLGKKKRRKPVEIAKALVAAVVDVGGLGAPERKAVVAEVARELPLQIPALFTQSRIDDAAAVQSAIARILQEAVARAIDEDEEDIEWLLMAA